MEGGERTALGLMSGTSMDGIDVAVITTDGLSVQAFGPAETRPYDRRLRHRLAEAVRTGGADRAALGALEQDLTEAHADAVEGFLASHGIPKASIDVVGFHGHTILHRPERRHTLQIGDGALLARRLGLPVVNDFRSTDVAAGGEGAPLAPLYHVALARGLDQPLAVLNLGGVGNVTYIGADTVIAFDTGPGNALIDDWVSERVGLAFDEGGRVAAAGRVDAAALARLADNPWFDEPPPKSLDRNDFALDAVAGLGPEDGAATLAAFTSLAVAKALRHLPDRPRRWLVTGGGRHNPTLMGFLARDLAVPVEPVEAVGWDGDALEAQAFAFLAVRSQRGLPLSLPTTTGVPQPLTGGRLHLPDSPAEPAPSSQRSAPHA